MRLPSRESLKPFIPPASLVTIWLLLYAISCIGGEENRMGLHHGFEPILVIGTSMWLWLQHPRSKRAFAMAAVCYALPLGGFATEFANGMFFGDPNWEPNFLVRYIMTIGITAVIPLLLRIVTKWAWRDQEANLSDQGKSARGSIPDLFFLTVACATIALGLKLERNLGRANEMYLSVAFLTCIVTLVLAIKSRPGFLPTLVALLVILPICAVVIPAIDSLEYGELVPVVSPSNFHFNGENVSLILISSLTPIAFAQLIQWCGVGLDFGFARQNRVPPQPPTPRRMLAKIFTFASGYWLAFLLVLCLIPITYGRRGEKVAGFPLRFLLHSSADGSYWAWKPIPFMLDMLFVIAIVAIFVAAIRFRPKDPYQRVARYVRLGLVAILLFAPLLINQLSGWINGSSRPVPSYPGCRVETTQFRASAIERFSQGVLERLHLPYNEGGGRIQAWSASFAKDEHLLALLKAGEAESILLEMVELDAVHGDLLRRNNHLSSLTLIGCEWTPEFWSSLVQSRSLTYLEVEGGSPVDKLPLYLTELNWSGAGLDPKALGELKYLERLKLDDMGDAKSNMDREIIIRDKPQLEFLTIISPGSSVTIRDCQRRLTLHVSGCRSLDVQDCRCLIPVIAILPRLVQFQLRNVELSKKYSSVSFYNQYEAPPSESTNTLFSGPETSMTNGVRMELNRLEHGAIEIANEGSRFEIACLYPYWIGKTEVTQSQWKQVMNTEPWKDQPHTKEGNDYPASCITWQEATEFCRRLTEQERTAGRLSEAQSYRLPTELEWELACRSATTTAYSFGDLEEDLGQHAWCGLERSETADASESYAHRVAQKTANPAGLFDMHGNVREWCVETVRIVSKDDPMGDTPATKTDDSAAAVWRGGGWCDPPDLLQSSAKGHSDPDDRDPAQGFRVVLIPSP